MKLPLLTSRLQTLLHQRNALFALIVTLLSVNALQSLTILLRQERIVMIPPGVSQSFWIEGGRVSPSYIEEMTLFLSGLILETSPASTAYRRDLILRYTLAESYGPLKVKLLEDEKRLQKERVVTSFQPNTVKVSGMSAEITGDLTRFVGEKRISQSRDTYRLTFVFRHGRLFVESFRFLRSNTHA